MISVDKNTVGQKVRELRKNASMTQQELAGLIGVKQSDLSRMENGEYRVSLSALVKILGVLDMSVSEFFGEEQSLANEETALLDTFRNLNDKDRRSVLQQVQKLGTRKTATGG